MADQEDQDSKTEAPTPQRIRKFRERGEVAFSREVTAAASLAAAGVAFVLIGDFAVEELAALWRDLLARFVRPPDGDPRIDGPLFVNIMTVFVRILALPMALSVGVILLAGLSQTKLNFSLKSLEPKWNKFNPLPQLQKMFFSPRTAFELTRSILKVSVLAAVAIWALWGQEGWLGNMPHMALSQSLGLAGSVLARLLTVMLFVAALMAAVDYAWQSYQLTKRMRMSKQDIKDEYKQQEGDPMVKGQRRARMRQMARERSQVQKAADATVVVVNPTHIAVALRYVPGEDAAPMVLCKGKDRIAAEIRKVARDAGVPVLQRKPLARLMFKTCKAGEAIPVDLYQAVAQVLAVVMRIKQRRGGADV